MISLSLNYLLKALSANKIILQIWNSTYAFEGGGTIQCTASLSPVSRYVSNINPILPLPIVSLTVNSDYEEEGTISWALISHICYIL